jgi:hypothetical protein
MKKLLATTTIAFIITSASFGQQEEKLQKLEKLENKTDTLSDNDTTVLEIGDKAFSIKESGDETRINIGNKEIIIVEKGDKNMNWRIKKNDGEDDEKNHKHRSGFQGHLGGIEFGFNGYLTDFWSTALKPSDYYLDLNTAKSNNWNFIFPCVNIGMMRHFGIVSALGLSFNNYRFDGNNSITKDEDGIVGSLSPAAGITYTKTKLVTTYATLPVLLEVQIPVASGHTINLGAGVIGAVKLGSHTKVVYYSDGREKEKRRDDFSLNVLRYGVTGRVGYESVQIYGTCYLSPVFENGKGPELYPFEVGIAFTIND